jgi:hypothetical protein
MCPGDVKAPDLKGKKLLKACDPRKVAREWTNSRDQRAQHMREREREGWRVDKKRTFPLGSSCLLVSKPLFTKHIPIVEQIQQVPHFFTKLSNFSVIGRANWRATNVLWASEVNEQLRKHRKRMSDSLLQKFWKNSSRL